MQLIKLKYLNIFSFKKLYFNIFRYFKKKINIFYKSNFLISIITQNKSFKRNDNMIFYLYIYKYKYS